MRIAVDAMGGDFAPGPVVEGAFLAAVEDGAEVLLVGDEDRIGRELALLGDHQGRIQVVHAEEVVGMEESATTPLRRKPRSSIRLCVELIKEGRAAAMVTAGNTGAAMAAAKVVLGTIPGIERPALTAELPTPRGRSVLLDVGANVDSKPAHLREFAVMGHFYAQQVLGVRRPRIGLLSIGEEEGKGSEITREVFKILQGTGLDFVGNVEGRNVFNGSVDVTVCDGFVGNAVLKSAEAVADLFASMLRQEIRDSWRARLGYWLAKPVLTNFRRRTDYAAYGAAPLLGIDGGCFIGHGRSNQRAIRSGVRRAREFVRADVMGKIATKVAELHDEEVRVLGRWRARRER